MKIDKNVFKKIGQVASKDATRYVINGVHFKRTGGVAQADVTDGRILVQAKWQDKGEDFDTILEAKSIQGVKLRSRTKYVSLEEFGRRATRKVQPLSSIRADSPDPELEPERVAVLDGRFPKIEDVVPEYDIKGKSDCVVFHIDPALFATLLKTVADVGCDEWYKGVRVVVPITRTAAEIGRPVLVQTYNPNTEIETTGLIMPVSDRGRGEYRAPSPDAAD